MSWIASLASFVLSGVVIGALGRLVVPGPNPLSLPATIGIGLVGALVGGLVAGSLGFGWLVTILLEIGLAAVLVWLIGTRPEPTPTEHQQP